MVKWLSLRPDTATLKVRIFLFQPFRGIGANSNTLLLQSKISGA